MANYVYSTLILNGSKEAIVNLLNKALKHDKSSKRLSARMTGKRIASLTYCLTESSFLPRPKTYDHWDTTNSVNSFFNWFCHGCKNDQPAHLTKALSKLSEKRHAEIYNYLVAHPELFKPLPTGYRTALHLADKDSETSESSKQPKPRFPSEYYNHALELLHPKLLPAYRRYVRGYYRARKYQQDKYGAVGWREWSNLNYGCKWATFGGWKCLRDENGVLCLAAHVQSPWSPPHKIFDYISSQDGITAYAHGYDICEWGYTYVGTTHELTIIDPSKDICREDYLQELAKEKGIELTEEAISGKVEGFYPQVVDDRIISERTKAFENEIFLVLGFDENPLEKLARRRKKTTPSHEDLPF